MIGFGCFWTLSKWNDMLYILWRLASHNIDFEIHLYYCKISSFSMLYFTEWIAPNLFMCSMTDEQFLLLNSMLSQTFFYISSSYPMENFLKAIIIGNRIAGSSDMLRLTKYAKLFTKVIFILVWTPTFSEGSICLWVLDIFRYCSVSKQLF